MPDDRDQLTDALADLKARVARLEHVLGIAAPRPPEAAAPARAESPAPPPAAAEGAAPKVVAPIPIPAAPARPAAPPAPAPPTVPTPPARRAREPFSIERLERAIGARWYAAAGAVVVVIALGLFFKFAYDQGWLRVPPAFRCAGGGLFGVALVCAGEFLRRRMGALAAAGLYATGIGCVYVSAYAAYRLHVIESPGTAFALLASVAVAGVLVASRARLPLVAAASLIAGYVTPFLFVGVPPQPLVLPSYLLMLLAVGLGLSIRMGGRFEALRTLCWVGTVFLGAFWVLSSGRDHVVFALAFLGLVWAAVHAELFVAAGRGFSKPGETDSVLRLISGAPLREVGRAARGRLRPYLTSFCTTAWSVSLGVFATRGWASPPDWLAPAAATLATGALAGIMAGGAPVLLGAPRNDRERLGAALLAQKAALALVTITAAFTGWVESLTYISLGLAVVIARRWLRMPAFTVYGLVSLAIGTARVALYDSWAAGLAGGGVERFGLVFSWWMLLAAVCAGVWLAAGALILPPEGERKWRAAARACVTMGAAMLFGAIVHRSAEPASICLAWAALSAGFCAARRLSPLLFLDALGLCGLVLAVGAWAVAYPAHWDAARSWPLFYPGFVVALALAAGEIGAAEWLARNPAVPRAVSGEVRRVTGVGAGLLIVVASGLEAGRLGSMASSDPTTPGVAVSVWSGLAAFAYPAIGLALLAARRWVRMPAFTVFGLVLLVIGTARVVLYDSWAGGLAVGVERFGLVFSWWMILAFASAAAWFAAAALLLPAHGNGKWQSSARVCATLGAAILLGAVVHDDAEPSSICLAWAALSAGLCAARKYRPTLFLDALGLCGLVLAVGAWAVAYPARDWDAGRSWPILYPGFVVAVLLSAGVVGAASWLAQNRTVPKEVAAMVRGVTGIGVGILLFVASSLEVARIASMATADPMTRGAAVSVWWGLVAFGLIGAGFRLARGVAPADSAAVRPRVASALRWVGLALLATAAAKGLLIDIRGVDPLWRIGAVFVLGLLMLGVHLVYTRIGARATSRPPAP